MASSLCAWRNASISVMSAQSFCVTCGAFSQLRCKFGPAIFWIRVSFRRSMAPNFEKSITGIAGSAEPPPLGTASSCLTNA